ncbi:hypothetical protein [Nocardia terpenica]|uniref:Uncharacterized protein n=1 Tax=Nocardia terpenica TaxID=455432 RepID=A0A6G9ZEX8_9NOCA|nr:hypothetical protein [Nocardia terpenica]QIS23656.1 hypothetical protein F6W96_40690 [Nocardia terpenica]
MTTKFVRFTMRNGSYLQWLDHGPDRPALISWYGRISGFAFLERDPDSPVETTREAIERLAAQYPEATMSRLIRNPTPDNQ